MFRDAADRQKITAEGEVLLIKVSLLAKNTAVSLSYKAKQKVKNVNTNIQQLRVKSFGT